MQPQFKAPVDEAEFKKRADEMTLAGAKSVLEARRRQREDATKPFDVEIEFLEKVIAYKEKNV